MDGCFVGDEMTGRVAVTVSRWMGGFLEREQATGRVAVTACPGAWVAAYCTVRGDDREGGGYSIPVHG